MFIELALWENVQTNPIQNIRDLVKDLRSYGCNFSARYVKCIFKRWKWSWKKPQFKQLNKYSIKNIEYYGSFVFWLHSLTDWKQVKFLDEVHFVSKGIVVHFYY